MSEVHNVYHNLTQPTLCYRARVNFQPPKSLLPSSNLCDVSQWLFILDQHLGKLQALFRVDPHHIPQQKDPIWSVAHLKKKKF